MDEDLRKWLKIIGFSVLGLIIMITACGSCFSVKAGHVGVKFNTINGQTQSYQQGMYLKTPWIENITKFDVRTLKEDIKADSASKDLQKVMVHVVINYHLDYLKVNDLYVKVGEDYSEKVIHPAVNEAIKASTAQFPVEQIIVDREKLKEITESILRKRLTDYNIILESVNLVNINFDEEFNKVVEQKQIEEQKIKTAQYQREQAFELKKKTILEAEAEAQKQNLLRQTTSKEVINLKWIEKWDGKLPNYVLGDKAMIMMNEK